MAAARRHGARARPSPFRRLSAQRYSVAMDVHLVDGTYELFRHFYAMPSARDAQGAEVAAVRGVIASLLSMISGGATHIGVATDHVIESFRNALWRGYKTGAGIARNCWRSFHCWKTPCASPDSSSGRWSSSRRTTRSRRRAAVAADDPRVDACSSARRQGPRPVVRGTRVVQVDRRRRSSATRTASWRSSACRRVSIPDYLALVGDAADGYPGLPGWGAKSAAAVLAKFGRIEDVPGDWRTWRRERPNPAGSRERSRSNGTGRCCFELWRP